MMTIDELAYGSKLAKASPKAKMVFATVPLVLCLCLDAFSVSVMTALLMGAATVGCGGIPARKYIRLLLVPLGFLLLGTATVIFGRCGAGEPALVLFRVSGLAYGISARSLLYGSGLILKALGCVSCMYFIALNTTMNDLMAALRNFGLPGLFVSLMELIYRYIFVFLDEARRIRTAQDSRLGYSDFKTGMNSLGSLAGTLFLRTYDRCDRIYAALQSRGYDGEFKALKREYPPSGRMYAGCVLISLMLLAAGLWEKGVWSFLS